MPRKSAVTENRSSLQQADSMVPVPGMNMFSSKMMRFQGVGTLKIKSWHMV